MTDMDHIERLLDAERAVLPPPGKAPVELERLFQAVASPAAPLPVAAGSLKLGSWLITQWIGVGFLIGTAGAGIASYGFSAAGNQSATVAPALVQPAKPTLATSVSVQTAPVLVTTPSASAVVASVAHDSKPTPAPPVSTSVPGSGATSTFDEELKVITAAKRELDAGKPHLARIWLDQHRERFPRGVFSLEREGLSIVTTCTISKNPTLALEFARQHADSPMLQQVLRRCGVQDTNTPTQSSGSFLEPDK